MQDKVLTTAEKNKLWLDLYHEIMGVKKEKQSDATNSIETQSGVIAVRYPRLRNAEFEPTYWASWADKVRVAKSGETKVLATLDCNPTGGLSGMDITSSNSPVVAVACLNELRLMNVLTGEMFKFPIGPLKGGAELRTIGVRPRSHRFQTPIGSLPAGLE
jgi:hypothetical protein